MIKVAHFTDSYKPQVNGVVTSILNLNSFLKSKGVTPVVLAPGKKEGVKEDNGIAVYSFPSLPFPPYPGYLVALPNLPETVKICSYLQVKVLHSHSPFSMGFSALYTKNVLNLPCVGTFHTLYPEYLSYLVGTKLHAYFSTLLRKPSWGFLKFYYSSCDVVTCPSKTTARQLEENEIKNYEIVPNGVNIERFSPDVSGSGFRKKLGCNGRKVVLYLGRLGYEKNIEAVLRAAKSVKDAFFIIAGKGPYLPKLKALARKENLENISFLGYVSEQKLAECYASCDVFVMPSKTETQGITVLEAMACGKPVVVFKGASSEVVHNRADGFIVRNEQEFIGKIADLLANEKKRAIMGRRARKTAEENSIEKLGSRMLKIYESLV